MFALRLTRKSAYHVGSQTTAWKCSSQKLHAMHKSGSIVLSVHSGEYSIAAALHRQMEVRADVSATGQTSAKILRHCRRLKTA